MEQITIIMLYYSVNMPYDILIEDMRKDLKIIVTEVILEQEIENRINLAMNCLMIIVQGI